MATVIDHRDKLERKRGADAGYVIRMDRYVGFLYVHPCQNYNEVDNWLLETMGRIDMVDPRHQMTLPKPTIDNPTIIIMRK